jgi:hypothetical protein
VTSIDARTSRIAAYFGRGTPRIIDSTIALTWRIVAGLTVGGAVGDGVGVGCAMTIDGPSVVGGAF